MELCDTCHVPMEYTGMIVKTEVYTCPQCGAEVYQKRSQMDIYEVTVIGTFKTVRFEVMSYGMWDTWEQYDDVQSSPDFPKGVGRIIEIKMKYLRPMVTP